MKKETYTDYSIIVINGFFLLSFMLLVLFGTSIYSHVYKNQIGNNFNRSLSSYLLTISRMNEAAIYEKNIDGRDVLVIEDGDTGYGNRIYVEGEYLMEDYGKLGSKLSPSAAVQIAPTSEFRIEKVSDELLKITTSAGTVFIHTMKAGAE